MAPSSAEDVASESESRADNEPVRVWTDSSGKFSVNAQLVDYANGKLHLKREDGTIVRVPFEKISFADRDHLRTWIKANR